MYFIPIVNLDIKMYLQWFLEKEWKWKLLDITNTYLLKTMGDPHRAGKLITDSPHKAAVDNAST